MKKKMTTEENNNNEDVLAFLKEYGELVAKHQVDFANYPVYVPDGQGGFKTIIQNTPVSLKNRPQEPQKSPFVA